MRRLLMVFVFVGCMVLILGACGDEEGGDKGASSTVSKHSLIKEPTRPHPGWACPSHPNVKSFNPDKCPIDNLPMMRQGEYTCPNHPQVSAAAPGKCPIGGEPLVTVKDLEKQTGKTIDQLTQEALAKAKQ